MVTAGPQGPGDPAQTETLYRQGFALHQQQRLEEARALYEQTLQRQPRHFGARLLLGLVELQSGNPQRSAEQTAQAIALDPGHAAAHNYHGSALLELGRPEAAVASYDRALALQPDYADAYNNRGLALRELGRDEEALASHEQAIRIKPDNAEAYLSRSVLMDYRGNRAEALPLAECALTQLRAAIARMPDDPRLSRDLPYYEDLLRRAGAPSGPAPGSR